MKEALLIWQATHTLCILACIAALIAGIVTFVQRGSSFQFGNIVLIWATIGVSTFGAILNGILFILLTWLQSKRADPKLFFRQKVVVLLGSLVNLVLFAAETAIAASLAHSSGSFPGATPGTSPSEVDTSVSSDCQKSCRQNFSSQQCDSLCSNSSSPQRRDDYSYTPPNALIAMCSIAAAFAFLTVAADVVKLYTRDRTRQKDEADIGMLNAGYTPDGFKAHPDTYQDGAYALR